MRQTADSTVIAEQIGCAQQWVSKVKQQVTSNSNLTPKDASKKGKRKRRVQGKDGKQKKVDFM
jgi:hypothetical protein